MNDVNDGVVRWLRRIGGIASEGEDRLKGGRDMLKWCRGMMGRKCHTRYFTLAEGKKASEGPRLNWGPTIEACKKGRKSVAISDIRYVEGGEGGSSGRGADEDRSLRVGIPEGKELSLESENSDERDTFVADLYAVCYYYALCKMQVKVGEREGRRVGRGELGRKVEVAATKAAS